LFTVEYITQVIRVDDSKRADRRERHALLAVQLIGSLPISYEFSVRSTRQVHMTTEGTPALVIAVAADSRSAVAFE
jgi:hypothetical protein